MLITLAAFVFLVLTAATVLFQLALAAGVPWGRLTWGGRFPGTLPARMRGVALFSGLLLAAFGIIVATRAGLLALDRLQRSPASIWVVVVYCALGVLANAATTSKWERRIWLPVVGAMFCSSLLIATTA